MANINGKVCCKAASFSLADSYDSLPPELRQILRNAPYDLRFDPGGTVLTLHARGDTRTAVAVAQKSIANLLRKSALATYGPDHPQAQYPAASYSLSVRPLRGRRESRGRPAPQTRSQIMAQTDMQKLLAALQAVGIAVGPQPTKTRKGKSKKAKGKLSDADRAAYMAKNDAECVAAFTKAGYKDVQPRINVLTYDKWVQSGRLVRKGEKSVKVGPFSLFHLTQTDPIAAALTPETATANTTAA